MPQPTEAVTQHMMAGLLINHSDQPGETLGTRGNLFNMNCSFSKSIGYMVDAPYYEDKASLDKIRARTGKRIEAYAKISGQGRSMMLIFWTVRK